MWHDHWSGAGWALMSVMMLVFWTLVVVAVVGLVRWVGAGRGDDRGGSRVQAGPSARDILDERYARGELTDEEYRTRRDALSGR